MLQATELVYVNGIEYYDGGTSCVMDPFVITTCIGKHVATFEVRMLGEDHGTGMVVPREDIRRFADINVLHQELMAKDLREDDVAYIDLEYHEVAQITSPFH